RVRDPDRLQRARHARSGTRLRQAGRHASNRAGGRLADRSQGSAVRQHVRQRLERELAPRFPGRSIDVLNFGVAGFGPVASWARFENLGRRFAPDLVLYLFIDNDPDDVETGRDVLLYRYDGKAMRLQTLRDDRRTRIERGALDFVKQHCALYGFF